MMTLSINVNIIFILTQLFSVCIKELHHVADLWELVNDIFDAVFSPSE